MNAADLEAVHAQVQDQATDALMQARYGTKPINDPSGLLGQPSAPPAEASEDEQFEAYFARSFLGAVAPVSEQATPCHW